MDQVETSEASGFAIAEAELPVIAVNRKDVVSRRTFTLLHEFAHLLLRESGVSEFYIDVRRPPEEQKIEVWCNAVAAATLIPKAMFLEDNVVKQHRRGVNQWSEEEIDILADTFSMSRVSVVRRMLTLGLTSRRFYQDKEREYADDYAEFLKRKKAQNQERDFTGRNMPVEAFSLLGRNFIRMVMAPYHDDKITLSDVSSYLNLKTRHIPKVEKMLLGEVSS